MAGFRVSLSRPWTLHILGTNSLAANSATFSLGTKAMPRYARGCHWHFFAAHRFWLKNGITWFWNRSATALVWVP
jgi:hypothetical protein